jgi:hypothetical protein
MLCSYFNLIHCMHICLITHTICLYAHLLITNTCNLIFVFSLQVLMDEYSCVYCDYVGPSSFQDVINHSIAYHQRNILKIKVIATTPTNKTCITNKIKLFPLIFQRTENYSGKCFNVYSNSFPRSGLCLATCQKD